MITKIQKYSDFRKVNENQFFNMEDHENSDIIRQSTWDDVINTLKKTFLAGEWTQEDNDEWVYTMLEGPKEEIKICFTLETALLSYVQYDEITIGKTKQLFQLSEIPEMVEWIGKMLVERNPELADGELTNPQYYLETED